MTAELKPVVSMAETFDLLDIRVGRFGVKISVARLTQHRSEDLIGRQILGVLNVGLREVGGIVSEFLCLGVQFPKAQSGEATVVTPVLEVKLGSKLF
jgi:tRNA-binding protein